MKTLIFALFISASCFAQTNRFEDKFIKADSLFNLKYEKNMAALNKEIQANLIEVFNLMQQHSMCEADKRDMSLNVNLANRSFKFCILKMCGFRSFKCRVFRFDEFNDSEYNKRMIVIIERMLQP